MKELVNAFINRCKDLQFLVLGDLMLDQYMWGKMERISPEAPVPIVDIQSREIRLGGAANAALNICSLGASCMIGGVVGKDKHAVDLKELAGKAGMQTPFIFEDTRRKTTLKTRIICHGQHVLRIDEEDRNPLPPSLQRQIIEQIGQAIPQVDGIIFSDYDKGFIGKKLIQELIAIAHQHHVPIMVDPKFQQFGDYEGATLFKPNLKELNEGLGLKLSKEDQTGITAAIQKMRGLMPHDLSLITLSEEGMLLFEGKDKVHHLAAHRREIVDVSGAGDAVMAVVALAIAGGFSPLEAAQLANKAGGLVCEEVGVVPIRPARLLNG